MLDDVRIWPAKSDRSFIAVSETGTAVYVSHDMPAATLMWVDREGNTTPIRNVEGVLGALRLSPDGKTIAYDDEHGDLWTLDTERGSVELMSSFFRGGAQVRSGAVMANT